MKTTRLPWLFYALFSSVFFSSACLSQNDALDAKFNQATKALDESHYGEARSLLDEAEQHAHSRHEHSEIQYRRAEVYRDEGRLTQSAESFVLTANISDNPQRKARALLEAAHLWLRLQETEKALRQYREVYTLYPDSSAALKAAQAEVHQISLAKAGHDDSAPASSWRVIISNCNSKLFCEESRYQLARELEKGCADNLGECGQELVALYTNLAQNPSERRAALLDDIRIRLALIQREQGNLLTALKLLRITSKKPRSSWFVGTYDTASGAEAYYLLAETLYHYAQRPDEAIDVWRDLQRRFPDSNLVGPSLYNAAQFSQKKTQKSHACKLEGRVPPEYERWKKCLSALCVGTLPPQKCQRRPTSLRGKMSR